MLGLCLIAAFALGAVAAATSSAVIPEWGKCVKFVNAKGKPVGKYTDPGCTVVAEPAKTGEYEWQKLTSFSETGFTAHGGTATLEDQGIKTVCQSTEATGSLSGSKQVTGVTVIFEGCQSNFANLTCENGVRPPLGSEPAERIRTRELKGTLGYINSTTAPPEVGLSLEPAEAKNLFAEFICGQLLVARVGQAGFDGTGIVAHGAGNDSIISPITPVNVMTLTTSQPYTQKESVQVPTHFEGGPEDYLETEISDAFGEFPFHQSGQEVTVVNKLNSGEKIEIKATA